MVEVDIDYVKTGDILARNHSFTNYDRGSSFSVDLRKGAVLSDSIIKKLKTVYNIKTLWIEDPTTQSLFHEPIIKYNDEEKKLVVNKIIKNFNEISESNILSLEELTGVAQNIITDVINKLFNDKNGFFSNIANIFARVDSHDVYTYEHSVNCAIYGLSFAIHISDIIKRMKTSEKGIKSCDDINELYENIVINLLLHDIGKMQIPDSILNKESKLTKEEFEIMSKHPRFGYEMFHKINDHNRKSGLQEIPSTYMVACLFHHQKWDGSGYPDFFIKENGEKRPLKGREIPLIGRIAAIVDTYDALTTKRPYRKRYHTLNAIQIMKKESGKQLDPFLLEKFIEKVNIYPMGSTVRLSNGDLGLVVGYNNGNKYMPIVSPYLRKIKKGFNWDIQKLYNQPPIIIGESKVKIIIDDQIYERYEETEQDKKDLEFKL